MTGESETHEIETQLSSMADTKPADALQDREEEVDDHPTLSPYALAALQEFLAQQMSTAEGKERESDAKEAVQLLPEDWRLSQFWYSPETAHTIAEEVFSVFTQFSHDSPHSRPSVACIACPTLFAYLKVSLS